jgi:hypothetical protein
VWNYGFSYFRKAVKASRINRNRQLAEIAMAVRAATQYGQRQFQTYLQSLEK